MKTTCKLVVLLCSLLLFAIGFFTGRQTMQTKTSIEFVEQETVSGSISNNQLITEKEEMPPNPNLPIKRDTVYKDSIRSEIKYIIQKVDTAAIIAGYILKKSYNLTAFESKELGTLKLFPTVQYNQLLGLDYEFTPIQRQVTVYKEKVWQPFLSGSYSTLNHVSLGGGIFYHNLGFEYQYQKDITGKNDGHLLGLKYKF